MLASINVFSGFCNLNLRQLEVWGLEIVRWCYWGRSGIKLRKVINVGLFIHLLEMLNLLERFSLIYYSFARRLRGSLGQTALLARHIDYPIRIGQWLWRKCLDRLLDAVLETGRRQRFLKALFKFILFIKGCSWWRKVIWKLSNFDLFRQVDFLLLYRSCCDRYLLDRLCLFLSDCSKLLFKSSEVFRALNFLRRDLGPAWLLIWGGVLISWQQGFLRTRFFVLQYLREISISDVFGEDLLRVPSLIKEVLGSATLVDPELFAQLAWTSRCLLYVGFLGTLSRLHHTLAWLRNRGHINWCLMLPFANRQGSLFWDLHIFYSCLV